MSEPTTVRDIEWHVSTEYPRFVCAEDQPLFAARQYAEQVVDEHNGYLAMRDALAALLEASDALLWELVEAEAISNMTIVNLEKAVEATKQLLDAPTVAT